MAEPYRQLAEIAFASKDWEQVVELTDTLIKSHSGDVPIAYLYNAAANFNMGNIDAAEVIARRFESLDVKHLWPQAYLLMGDILQQKGDYLEAAQQMRIFLSMVPNDPFARAIAKEADRLQRLSDGTNGKNSKPN